MTEAEPAASFGSYSFNLNVIMRLATVADLPKLEWFGQYTNFRRVMERTLLEQRRGSRFLLVADLQGFPIGAVSAQIRRSTLIPPSKRHAYFYSLRVYEWFRGSGIGTRLLETAERLAIHTGCVRASIAAAKDNPDARRLYERQGYYIVAEDDGHWTYTDHLGQLQQVYEPCWVLEKSLIVR